MRYVEIGRVVLTDNKLAVIIDVIDHNRVLVSGEHVARGPLNFKDCQLTDLTIKVPRACRAVTVLKCITEQKLNEKWQATAWAKKLDDRVKRKNMSDFDRFKLMIAKKQKRTVIGKAFAKLRRTVK